MGPYTEKENASRRRRLVNPDPHPRNRLIRRRQFMTELDRRGKDGRW